MLHIRNKGKSFAFNDLHPLFWDINGVVHDTALNIFIGKSPCECEMKPFLGEWMKDYIFQVHSWLTMNVQGQNEHNRENSFGRE